MIAKHGYVLETTSANSSFQNSKAEQLHCTLGNMMRSMLKCARLDKSFWVDALSMHAVYVRNCLPHATLGVSPFEKMTLRKPNLNHLRVFRSRFIVKEKDVRTGKLSNNCVIGIFLRFTGTDRNTYYYDVKTHQTQEAQHVDFDKTYFHEAHAPPYAQQLKNIVETEITNAEINKILPKHHSADSSKLPPPLIDDGQFHHHLHMSLTMNQMIIVLVLLMQSIMLQMFIWPKSLSNHKM